MAIILPHGVLFRGGAEAKIRRKLLDDGNIDTVIGLPANLFYSTGIPVCILVLKKCKKPDDVLFINASKHFEKGKRQNYLSDGHIENIIETYQQRPESVERYARRVEMDEIEANDFNLNISRYVSRAKQEVAIDLSATHKEVVEIEKQIRESNGLSPMPASESDRTDPHTLRLMARELAETVREMPKLDWTQRESGLTTIRESSIRRVSGTAVIAPRAAAGGSAKAAKLPPSLARREPVDGSCCARTRQTLL
jgi:N-6 DNA Methylase